MTLKPFSVLIMGYIWPEITSSAAGMREWNLINTFQKYNWNIFFSSASKENNFTKQLKEKNIQTFNFQPNDSYFNNWIENNKIDYVIFDRFVVEEQFGWRVATSSPNTIRILDTQDLHFLRKNRQDSFYKGINLDLIFDANIPLNDENCIRELSSIYRSDLSLILSDFELNLLKNKFQISNSLLQLSRFHYDQPLQLSNTLIPSFSDRQHFCMIGNFRHIPNSDGVLWLYNEIWPIIRQSLPNVELHIYGAYPSREIMELTDPSKGFYIKGPVKDHIQMLQKYRVNLAPLRFGAGIKGKITDGWYCGTPNVTTPIGSEGMSDNLPWGGYISTSSPNDFAMKSINLYTNQEEWEILQKNGYNILTSLHSHNINSDLLVKRLIDLKHNIETHRANNVIGQILNYNTMKSTKYFSLWIEEKNKNK